MDECALCKVGGTGTLFDDRDLIEPVLECWGHGPWYDGLSLQDLLDRDLVPAVVEQHDGHMFVRRRTAD